MLFHSISFITPFFILPFPTPKGSPAIFMLSLLNFFTPSAPPQTSIGVYYFSQILIGNEIIVKMIDATIIF